MFNRVITLSALMLTLTSHAHADSWQEREALAQVMREIRALQALANGAKANAEVGARIQFDYDQMTADLNAISAGVQQYLSTPLDPATELEEIEGEYTQTRPYRPRFPAPEQEFADTAGYSAAPATGHPFRGR